MRALTSIALLSIASAGAFSRASKDSIARRLGQCVSCRSKYLSQEESMSSATKLQGPYSVHPGVAQIKKWVEEMPKKTGRSLDEWIALTKKSGPSTEKERIAWLKNEHKLGTNSA